MFVLKQKQWALSSVIFFLFSIFPAFVLQGGRTLICQSNIDNDIRHSCLQTHNSIAEWSFLVLFLISLFSAFFAFRNDVYLWRIFVKIIRFLVPGSTIIIILGFNLKFCFMWSCSDFGEQAIAISLFCLTVFILALGWVKILRGLFKQTEIVVLLWITIFFVCISYLTVWKLNEKIKDHEEDVMDWKINMDKDSAMAECQRAFLSSTKNICLTNYSIKLHDESICREISSIDMQNQCIKNVKCSSFLPVYKTWSVKDSCSE